MDFTLENCLAKTYGEKQAGRNVLNHCQIVGEVARELMARMPDWLRAELFPEGSELVAACHDIGKVSPTFQEKIYRGTQGYQWNSIPELKKADPKQEKQWGGHAGVSFATADELDVGRYIPEILGQHHGYSPVVANLANDAVFGGKAWQQQRVKLIEQLKGTLKCDFPQLKRDEQAKAVVLAGLTSVADWIGSGSIFNDPKHDWQPLIQQALDNAGFIFPTLKKDLTFTAIFGQDKPPRDIQLQLIQACKQPGVYVLEAPMGIGKTEAALYAAYQLMQTNQATGFYFALPTQLTSDKIHERVNQFLSHILTPESLSQTATLVHGNAWLKQELGKEGQPGGSWFDNKKRGILAPFAVGTIDQALMAVMNVKHGFVRAFGLAGKVVILDEVHSYDMYTGTILDALVKQLRQWHCTVIILSATLTQQRRQDLLGQPAQCVDYPLISAKPHHSELQEISVESSQSNEVAIFACQNEEDALDEALKRAKQGQQVLWIENTVADAQKIFSYLNTEVQELDIKCKCGLLHSRFLKIDRENNENRWVNLYGKDNPTERNKTGRILVGTQVLEQSLDIDADFLVSRFAPTDMLLQRLGRLWRHDNSQRNPSAKCEAWILVPELNAAIADAKQAFDKTATIYAPYVLCRSLEVWHNLQKVSLPQQIRALIEATYSQRKESGTMLKYQNELLAEYDKLRRFALQGLSKAGKTLPETKASTRYGEIDSLQVLLVKKYRYDATTKTAQLTLLNDEVLHLEELKDKNEPKRRELAAQLLKNCVQVADYLAPKVVSVKDLSGLKDFIYLGKPGREECLLRIGIVDESDEIRALNGGVALEGYKLSYNQILGYQANKL